MRIGDHAGQPGQRNNGERGRHPDNGPAARDGQEEVEALHLRVARGMAVTEDAGQPARGERVIWAKLSARVGSIEDNRKGGWYGYRAAKAALNMVLQTAAIEASRKRPQLVMVAMQPGTVASSLSAPFVAPQDSLTPAQSVAGLLQSLDGLPAQAAAHFVDYQGEPIAW